MSCDNGNITNDDASFNWKCLLRKIVEILTICAKNFIKERRKSYLKNPTMQLLKEASVDANRLWKAANKTRQEPIFDKTQATWLLEIKI